MCNGATAEDRARHIADKIGECADSTGREACDLTWEDFRAYGDVAWGHNSLGIARRDITRLGGFNAIRDSYYPPKSTDNSQAKLRIRQHGNLNRRLGAHQVGSEFEFARIEEFSTRVFSGRIDPVKPKHEMQKGPSGEYERALVLAIGDMHFGSDLVAEETGGPRYGAVEEARRMAFVVKQAIDWKPEYRESTSLRVVLLGDLIHGCLHDRRDGAVISEQQSRAIHLLIQAIAHFAAAFPQVNVTCVTGNHGRDTSRHPSRATAGKWDSRETVIYSAAKAATSNLANVSWHIPLSSFATFEVFGKRYFVTHGDGVFNVGNPGTSINVGALEKQANRLNVTLQDRDEFAVIMIGHVHQSVQIRLGNGVAVIINGPFTPIDPFAVSLGLFESVSSQTMFEAVPGYPVGDLRIITLDERVDKDSGGEKIIKPWKEF